MGIWLNRILYWQHYNNINKRRFGPPKRKRGKSSTSKWSKTPFCGDSEKMLLYLLILQHRMTVELFKKYRYINMYIVIDPNNTHTQRIIIIIIMHISIFSVLLSILILMVRYRRGIFIYICNAMYARLLHTHLHPLICDNTFYGFHLSSFFDKIWEVFLHDSHFSKEPKEIWLATIARQ